jgi:hypothetical protein
MKNHLSEYVNYKGVFHSKADCNKPASNEIVNEIKKQNKIIVDDLLTLNNYGYIAYPFYSKSMSPNEIGIGILKVFLPEIINNDYKINFSGNYEDFETLYKYKTTNIAIPYRKLIICFGNNGSPYYSSTVLNVNTFNSATADISTTVLYYQRLYDVPVNLKDNIVIKPCINIIDNGRYNEYRISYICFHNTDAFEKEIIISGNLTDMKYSPIFCSTEQFNVLKK